jgi:hypothetical protein
MVASIASPIVRSALTAVEPIAHRLYDLNPPKWPGGPAQPIEKARFAEGMSLDFSSPGLDFPSPGLDFPSLRLGFSFPWLGFSFPWLGFSFPRFAQKENSAPALAFAKRPMIPVASTEFCISYMIITKSSCGLRGHSLAPSVIQMSRQSTQST